MSEEGSEKLNIEFYSKYRDAYFITYYILASVTILLLFACTRYRKIARLFYYVEIVSLTIDFLLPQDSMLDVIQTALLSLLIHVCFYVD